jgi:hypothetical protein
MKKITMFCLMALMVTTVQASVVYYSPTVNYQGSTIPPSLELNQVTSDTKVFLYDGFQGVELYGWVWNAYLVHFDPAISSPQKVVSGSIEFNKPIVAILGSEEYLDYYEGIFGPDTVYAGTRKLEDSGGNADEVGVIGASYNVVDFTLRATTGIDEFIIVEAEPVIVTTEIVSGPENPKVGKEECWIIRICVEADGVDVTGVVVQGGIGADLVVDDTELPAGVTLTQKGKKMGATIVTWDVGDLVVCEGICIELAVCTGLNPQDKQEYTSEGTHELDGGFSATYIWNETELKSPETVPLMVDAVLPAP